MKTQLPNTITSILEAKAFLLQLHKNGEAFHPEDDANDIVWKLETPPNKDECSQLNKLMDDIYNLPENLPKGKKLAFCPCGYLLKLIK